MSSSIFQTLGDSKSDSATVESAAPVDKRQDAQMLSEVAAKAEEAGTGQVLPHDDLPRLLDRQWQNVDAFGCSSASPYWKGSDRSLQGRSLGPTSLQATESSDSSDSSDEASESPTTAPPSEADPSEVFDGHAFVSDGILVDSL